MSHSKENYLLEMMSKVKQNNLLSMSKIWDAKMAPKLLII